MATARRGGGGNLATDKHGFTQIKNCSRSLCEACTPPARRRLQRWDFSFKHLCSICGDPWQSLRLRWYLHYPHNPRLSLGRRAIYRIRAMSRLRLGTSSLRKVAWRCFFTIGKLKQASSAISWLLRPSQTSRATSCSRLVSWTKCGKRELASLERGAAEERKSSHSIRKCGRATPAEPSCLK